MSVHLYGGDHDWQGQLRFDTERHSQQLGLPADWPRVNSFPEWFVVERDRYYRVTLGDSHNVVAGQQLSEGLAPWGGAAGVVGVSGAGAQQARSVSKTALATGLQGPIGWIDIGAPDSRRCDRNEPSGEYFSKQVRLSGKDHRSARCVLF